MYVKFAYQSGYSLGFTAYHSDGTGRGIANQPLYEVRPTGYYSGLPITSLASGDVVLVYILETIYYENDVVFILTQNYVFYEGNRVYYEGEWVFDFDDLVDDIVTWVGSPIGSGEYMLDVIGDNVDDLIAGQSTVNNIYDERVSAKAPQSLASTGRLVIGGGDC